MSIEQYNQDSDLYSRYVSYKSENDKQLRVIDEEIKAIKKDIEELEVCKTELDEDEISIIDEEIASKSSALKNFINKKDTLLNNPALSMLINTCRSNIMSHVGKFREKNYLGDDEIKNFYSMALDVCEITEDDIRMHEQLTNLEKENKKRTLGEASASIPFKELKHIKYALDGDERVNLSGVKVFSVRFGRVRDITGYVNVTPKKKTYNKLANFSHHMFGQTPSPSPAVNNKYEPKSEQKPSNTVWNNFSRDSMKNEAESGTGGENSPAKVGGGNGKKRSGNGNNKQAPKKSSNPYERLR